MGLSYQEILSSTLQKAKSRDYAGYEKFDALNSPLLHVLSFNNPWLRFFWIQAVKECPFPIRPPLGVRQYKNAKGIALFIRAFLFLYEKTKDPSCLEEAVMLGKWLINNPSPGQQHLSWGYSFDWQDIPPFYQKKDEPNIVVTCFAGEAFLHLFKLTNDQRYAKALSSIADFIACDIPVLYASENERAISYLMRRFNYTVLNVQVMAGAFLAKTGAALGMDSLINIGRKLVMYTVNRQTPYHAWYYTDPRGKSPIRHDNYHTGGILDNLLDFIEISGDNHLMDVYWKGLAYYKINLFEPSGAPRWMNDRRFPHDIHGAAQGIISFSKAARYNPEYRSRAEKIVSWTIQNMYRPKSCDFIYRKGYFFRWNYSLIRWCNAWMARALGEFIKE